MSTAPRRKADASMIDQILAGAERAFLDSGYDLATMDLVARHAGVARASVYNNFKSKEILFLAVMRRGVADFVARAIGDGDATLPPRQRLRHAAIAFLDAATEPGAMEMYRTVVAQSARFPDLSRTLHDQGLARIEVAFQALATDAGIAAPARFAAHLLAILMGGYFGPQLLGAAPADPPDVYVDRALAALMPPVIA